MSPCLPSVNRIGDDLYNNCSRRYEAMLATGTPPAFGSEVESAGQASTLCYNGILELHRVSGINQSNGKFVGSNTDAIQQIVGTLNEKRI